MAAHLAAGLLSAPEARWNHDQDRAPDLIERGPHQVGSGLQALYASKRIGEPEMTAAKRFRKDYTMGVLGVLGGSGGSSYEPRGCGCNVAALHAIQFARCAAVTAHRAIAEVLGAELTYLLVTLLVEDASFSAMARRFDPGGGSNARAMMSGRLEVLVCLLPTAYARLDRRRGGAARRRRDDLRAAAAGE